MSDSSDPQRVPRSRFAWLEEQSARWVQSAVIDDAARRRILAGYELESPHARGTTALVVLAALMVGIGVLLLIGYNWARLGPYTKVAIAMTLVAGLFAASALAFARRRPLAGETLALIGTFGFASSIWLIAQVLHIQGHFPDGFMWSAVGTLAAAAVLGSRWIGIEAAIFAVLWVGSAGVAPPHDSPAAFLLFGPLAAAAAYRLRSPVMLRAVAVALVLFVVFLDSSQVEQVIFIASLALTGCALYAVGTWHRVDSRMRRAWQSVGLVVLLGAFVVLLIADFHRFVHAGTWQTFAAAAAAVAAAITATLLVKRARDAAGVAVAGAGGVLVLWATVRMLGATQPPHLWVTVFSAVALLLAVSFIRTALRTDDPQALAFGTAFALAFLVVRWTSVVENMLWSGLMLLAAGAGLFLVARLWRHRDRHLALAGRTS